MKDQTTVRIKPDVRDALKGLRKLVSSEKGGEFVSMSATIEFLLQEYQDRGSWRMRNYHWIDIMETIMCVLADSKGGQRGYFIETFMHTPSDRPVRCEIKMEPLAKMPRHNPRTRWSTGGLEFRCPKSEYTTEREQQED